MDKELPVQDLNIDEVRQPPADNRIRVTWLGHASVLVQMNGISVLTDPVFSDRCGPIVFPRLQFGPRRYRRCPCTVQSLPDIDAVVISHSHYDHLDYR
jgi:N-acyl-phosphatidylethanolamine-hydrolysing phospholipase D